MASRGCPRGELRGCPDHRSLHHREKHLLSILKLALDRLDRRTQLLALSVAGGLSGAGPLDLPAVALVSPELALFLCSGVVLLSPRGKALPQSARKSILPQSTKRIETGCANRLSFRSRHLARTSFTAGETRGKLAAQIYRKSDLEP